jgi:PAS domain S-box-containing protein
MNKKQLTEEIETLRARVGESELSSSFRNIIQSSCLGIHCYALEPDGRLVFTGANPAADAILGLDNSQFIGKTIEEAFPASAQTELPERYRRACTHGEPWHAEQINYVENKAKGAFEVHAFPTTPGAMAAIFVEITDRKRSEKALLESEERFRRMAESIQDGLTIIEGERAVYVNDRACEIFGYAREELLKLDSLALAATEDKERLERTWREVCATGNLPNEFEYWIVRRDGTRRCVQNRYSLSYDEAGKIVGRYVVTTDVTERKQAEKLQESVYRIAQAVDTTSGLDELYSAVRDIVAEVMPASNFYIALYDPKENLLSFPYFVDEVDDPPPPQPPGRGLTAYVLRTGQSLLCDPETMRKLEGLGEVELQGAPSLVWLGVPLKIEGCTIGVMTVQHYRDAKAYGERERQMLEFVSSQVAKAIDRKRADLALRASEDLNRGIVAQTPLGTMYLDADGAVLYENPAMMRIVGLPEERQDMIVGRAIREVLALSPADYERTIERILRGSTISNERVEYRSPKGQIRVLDLYGAPRRDASGVIIGAVLMAVDTTEWVALERQYRQAQKMEAVGRLAGGIAHDFNNLITVISGNAELAMMSLGEAGPLRQDMQQILAAAERAGNLTRQLLAFSRRQTFHLKVVNMNEVILGMDKMLRCIIGEDVEFVTTAAPDLWNIEADPGSLEQVILNLVVNARDAMPMGGRLSIETRNVRLDEEYTREHPSTRPGPYVALAISDTGVGMTKEVKQQIFEPFFTTKELGRGTGLGLATVYGIIKQSGGNIWVYSEPGMGSTFRIYLPAVEKPAEVTQRNTSPAHPQGNETVLVVEDSDAVRSMVVRVLQQHGYEVLEARCGEEATMACRQMPRPADLLITDVVMPQMTGPKLAEMLHKDWPLLKVLYISGYTTDVIVHNGVLDPRIPFVQKPFSPIDLVRKVREILDQ